MDNITHSLVGILAAEAACVLRTARAQKAGNGASEAPAFRAAALLVSLLANNAPDADSFYASALSRPLGSLLHHRGHTHTLVAVPLLAVLAVGVTLAIARWRRWSLSRSDQGWLGGLGLFGVLLHVSLDFSNNYGVHPFWPFFDGWVYGDSIFIVEPFLWAALIPPLVYGMKTRTARIALGTLVSLGIALCWLRDFVPRSMALSVTLVAAGGALAAWRAGRTLRVALSAGLSLALVVVFVLSGRVARATARELLARDFPTAVTHDLVLTPMPADPLCWQLIAVQTTADLYLVRTGIVATAPSFMPARDCPFDIWSTPTAPSRAVTAPVHPELVWIREFVAPKRELGELARNDCMFSALLRFARVPYWTRESPLGPVAGDVRYDRSRSLEFADVALGSKLPCPRHLPPWIPPRKALFEAR